ncbi:putative L-type lectin-domain containing receptor kinase V.2 [Camellia lanceoleosa]|uniref:L-type lectin-domain containing receptor kinase V.2 n=1 Tax=Camellia lanceoleosa TaxID=1840588 RepID=A0ACC0HKY5_9ERIC|nr:putative L-type lectin-domain containing receptor kinase V.2 [Camellia lanceoleosa]
MDRDGEGKNGVVHDGKRRIRVAASDNNNGYGFTFNGNFKLGVGEAEVTPDSLVNVCNTTAFYSSPLGFKNPSTGKALSFSTTFVFSIVPEKNPYNYQSHGISFVIAPSNNIPGSSTPPAHIIAVELYMFNRVGVDVVNINRSTPAGYFENENGEFKKLTIASGEPIQAWVDYDGVRKKLNVSLAPINTNQPNLPLLSLDIDISSIVSDQMYVGFYSTSQLSTLGYIAPELARYGKSTTGTDVFAFGAFCLEVACGRKPVERRAEPGEVILVDWVLECSKKGEILKAADPKLKNEFEAGEMELVLKLGLLCSHPVAEFRPKMSQVLKYLKGYDSLPEDSDTLWTQEHWVEINDSNMSLSHHLTSQLQDSMASLTITELFTSKGR